MNKEQTLTALKGSTWLGRTHSDYVAGQYATFMTTGKFPYLSEVAKFIIDREGLTLTASEAKNLESLIYDAAKVYREEKEHADGWRLCSWGFLADNEGKKIEIKTEGLFGEGVIIANVRRVGLKLYIMKPKARTKHYLPEGLKVRPHSMEAVS